MKLLHLIPILFLISGVFAESNNNFNMSFDKNLTNTFYFNVSKYLQVLNSTFQVTGYYTDLAVNDSSVHQYYPDTNYGDSAILDIFVSRQYNNFARAYLRFNVTGIEPDINYYLDLYKYGGGYNPPNANDVHTAYINDTLVKDWDEYTITWNNQPCGGGLDINTSCKQISDPGSTYTCTNNFEEEFRLNVTEAVRNNISGMVTIVMYNPNQVTSKYDNPSFYDRESGSDSQKPLMPGATKNLTLYYGSDVLYNYTDELLTTETTSNLASIINSYTPTCTDIGNGTCSMNVTAHSDWKGGRAMVSNFAIQYGSLSYFGNCTENYTAHIFDLFTYNETNLNSQNATVEYTITLWDYNNSYMGNYSGKLQGASNYSLCTFEGGYYYADAMFRYWDSGYNVRTYYLDYAYLNNQTQNISLYLATTTESSGITINLLDQNGNEVSDALIMVQHYYVDLGEYKTVVIGKSDINGQSYLFLIPYDVWYKFIIVKDGAVLQTVDAMQIKSTSLTLTTSDTNKMEFFDYWDNIAYSCTENNATLVFSCTVTDTSGLMHNACLEMTKKEAITDSIVCSTCSASSSVTLICTGINSTANTYHYNLWGTFNDTYVIDSGWLESLIKSLPFGDDGLLLSGVLIGTVSLLGLFNPVVGIMLALVTLGISIYMGMFVVTASSLIGMVVVGIILAVKMRS